MVKKTPKTGNTWLDLAIAIAIPIAIKAGEAIIDVIKDKSKKNK
jgi:hypothetical protein